MYTIFTLSLIHMFSDMYIFYNCIKCIAILDGGWRPEC